ncbi:MAG: superoxide dismutase [Parachlamydiales bacterium]
MGVVHGQKGTLTPPVQEYAAKDYTALLGMPGFSDEALTLHFTLYQGYVKNTNLLLSILTKMARDGRLRTPEFMALKRRLGWEFDGMRLHEYYFDNMGGGGKIDSGSLLYKALMREFGTYEAWKQDFVATGMIRGIGWSVLYQDPQTGRLFNVWINEHDLGHLAGGTPLLVMDVWEHAVMPDYGIDRQAYIDAFFNVIDWKKVEQRYEDANNAEGIRVPSLGEP